MRDWDDLTGRQKFNRALWLWPLGAAWVVAAVMFAIIMVPWALTYLGI